MVKVSESEEEYIIEILHKNDFDLLIFTRENLSKLGLFAKITVKPKNSSIFGTFFSGGSDRSDRSSESDDLTIPYKWFHDMIIGNKTKEEHNESDEQNNKLTWDYFTSFFKPTQGEPTPEIVESVEELVEEPEEKPKEESVEESDEKTVEPEKYSAPGETSITVRIKKIGVSKLVKLKDYLKEIYSGPRTIEDFDETGMNYILLEKITFDLYKQFETLVQVHIVPTELNPEYIYKINGIYIYIDNSKMKMINDETEVLMRRNKEMFKTFIDELKFGETGKSENKINVIENTRIEKMFY